jgi:hypothetical protein
VRIPDLSIPLHRAIRRFSNRRLRTLLSRLAPELCGLLLVWDGSPAALMAQEKEANANQVKAAFIVKIAQYVEWPETAFANADAPVVIGILGRDPFGPDFDEALSGQRLRGRVFSIQRYQEPPDEGRCHLLFISRSESNRLRSIFSRFATRPVLTIGDVDRFSQQGGIINFIQEEGKIRFEINVDACKRANLRISSKLLQVSRLIRDGS